MVHKNKNTMQNNKNNSLLTFADVMSDDGFSVFGSAFWKADVHCSAKKVYLCADYPD